MFKGWIDEIPNVRFPKVGPRAFTVVRIPSPCSAGWLDPDNVKLPRGVVHETQTKLVPGYAGTCPTVTVGPRRLGGAWVLAQHLEVGRGACALKHPSGTPETNNATRIQIEICGYTTRAVHLPDAPIEAIALLESFFMWCEDHCDIPLIYPYDPTDMATGTWAVTNNPWRKAGTWNRKAGWHPHAAVINNDHWDDGGLDVEQLFPTVAKKPMRPSYGMVEIWKPEGDDHRHLEEIIEPLPTLSALYKVAATKENRARVRKALATKGHVVRIVKRQVAA